ncbi:MAG: hypothetical protein K5769_07090 [Pseudobutyrivibrio sp.]|nr:hypothetical protein [Pseudobutyrivibrio sp.]
MPSEMQQEFDDFEKRLKVMLGLMISLGIVLPAKVTYKDIIPWLAKQSIKPFKEGMSEEEKENASKLEKLAKEFGLDIENNPEDRKKYQELLEKAEELDRKHNIDADIEEVKVSNQGKDSETLLNEAKQNISEIAKGPNKEHQQENTQTEEEEPKEEHQQENTQTEEEEPKEEHQLDNTQTEEGQKNEYTLNITDAEEGPQKVDERDATQTEEKKGVNLGKSEKKPSNAKRGLNKIRKKNKEKKVEKVCNKDKSKWKKFLHWSEKKGVPGAYDLLVNQPFQAAKAAFEKATGIPIYDFYDGFERNQQKKKQKELEKQEKKLNERAEKLSEQEKAFAEAAQAKQEAINPQGEMNAQQNAVDSNGPQKAQGKNERVRPGSQQGQTPLGKMQVLGQGDTFKRQVTKNVINPESGTTLGEVQGTANVRGLKRKASNANLRKAVESWGYRNSIGSNNNSIGSNNNRKI